MTREEALKIVKIVEETYNRIAKQFSSTRQFLWTDFAYFAPFFQESQSILDVGCGNARILEMLKEKQAKYTGLDISGDLLEEAKSNWSGYLPTPEFIHGSFLDVTVEENKYDLVICTAVMQHLPQPLQKEFTDKLYSILKPGGHLLMTNWNMWQGKYFKILLKNLYASILGKKRDLAEVSLGVKDVLVPWTIPSQNLSVPRFVYAFTKSEITHLLKNSGFKIFKAFESKYNIIHVATKNA